MRPVCVIIARWRCAETGSCDRDCLKGFVARYLDAMLEHKPESLPVTPGLRFTEDCKQMKLGEGLWKNISGLTDYRRDILDVRNRTAVSFPPSRKTSRPSCSS